MPRRWLMVLAALVATLPPALALALATPDRDATAASESVARAPGLRGGALPPDLAGAPAPRIDLRDAAGGRGGTGDVAGRPYLVTFAYTDCPDQCPATAASIAVALRLLEDRADDVGVLAVSVDPDGDTPAAARAFLRRHRLERNGRYLLGTRGELQRTWRDWLVGGDEAGGPETHSLATWLVDRRGRLRAIYTGGAPPPDDLAHDLGVVLRERA